MRNFLPALSLALVFSTSSFAQKVRLAGTDFFKGGVSSSIETVASPLGLEARWPGSYVALRQLQAGKVDMAILAAPSPDNLPDLPGMYKMPLAYRLCRVIVAKDNPVESITKEQLRAIFGSRARLRHESWRDLAKGDTGSSGGWSSRVIEPMVTNAFSSFSREVFLHNVLHEDALHPSVKSYPDEAALQKAFAGKRGAIAVVGSLSVEGYSKALPVDMGAGEPFGATPENLYFGDYPLHMPCYLYFPSPDAAKLLPVVEAIYSGTVAQAIFLGGMAPVPDSFRDAEVNKLRKAAGIPAN
jgi:ABC-type phosphate transport system substrate-binding protein